MENKTKLIKYSKYFVIILCLFVFSISGCCALEYITSNRKIDPNIDPALRAEFAQPLELPGLKNFYKVSDDLYRGAQPTDEGMKQLEKLGIKTVVNLRAFHSDSKKLKDTTLEYEYIGMNAWNPKVEDAVSFLQVIADSNYAPVFVHCKQGSDRTGTMCAIYRIVVQGWSKEDAIVEMTKGGYGYHAIWFQLPGFIRKLDVDKIEFQTALK